MRKAVKVVGLGAGVVVVLAAVGFAVASAKASARLSQHFESHRADVAAPADPEHAVARGQHLVEAIYGCNICHGPNLAGGVMIEDAAIGSIRGPNITSGLGGRTANYKPSDWDRIVRHGIKPDGSPAVMPSEDFFKMSDAELADIVAYVTSRPPVDAEVPAPSFGPVGTVLVALGKFPVSAEALQDHQRPHASAAPPAEESVAFGEHLANICITCHRENLAGGPMPFGPPGWPAAGNLTSHASGLGGWTYDDFERAITTGISKSGKELQAPMTLIIPSAQKMTSTERKAIWAYLGSLPPRVKNR